MLRFQIMVLNARQGSNCTSCRRSLNQAVEHLIHGPIVAAGLTATLIAKQLKFASAHSLLISWVFLSAFDTDHHLALLVLALFNKFDTFTDLNIVRSVVNNRHIGHLLNNLTNWLPQKIVPLKDLQFINQFYLFTLSQIFIFVLVFLQFSWFRLLRPSSLLSFNQVARIGESVIFLLFSQLFTHLHHF